MEEEERAEEAAGARITVKKKGKGKAAGRQTKLTGGSNTGNSLKETRPSPFAEVVDPVIPEFCTEKKKPAGKGRKRVKAEPKLMDDDGDLGAETSKEDSKQKKLTVESSKVKLEGGTKSKKGPAEKSKSGAAQAKKRKVKEMLDSFEIGSDGEEEEEEVEKKSLKERIELRKTKTTDYKEADFLGDESVESEGSWKIGSDDDFKFGTPSIKKVKVAAGGKTAAASEGGQKDPKPVGGEGKAKTGVKKTTVTVKPTSKPATKPTAKKVTSASSSSGSSGEKKKTVPGKKSRVVSHGFYSDDESDDNISIGSGSGSDSYAPPAKKLAAMEVMCFIHVLCKDHYNHTVR